jgi:tetratricopeptide (TPR) repeat protein
VPLRDRLVEVIADGGRLAKPRYRYGSGCIVRGRTLLTVAHVVADAASVQVRYSDKTVHEATKDPRFVGDATGPGPDLALVEIDDPALDLPPMGLARLNRDTPTASPVTECHAIGYPWFAEAQSPTAVRETVDAIGIVPVLSKLAAGLLSIHVSDAPRPLPPEQVRLGQSEWSGMSGAPIVAAGLLLGVVTEHAPREGSSTITGVPVSAIQPDPAHPRWGPGAEDPAAWWERLGVTGIEELRPLPGDPPRHDRYAVQARCLTGRVAASVDHFLDRVKEMGQITAELEGGDHRILCITGRRGSGKSALAAAVLAPYEHGGAVDALVYLSGARNDADFALQTMLRHLLELVPPDDLPDSLDALLDKDPVHAIPGVLSLMRDRNLVVLLDNVDDMLTTGHRRYEGLLALIDAICSHPGATAIVTTSERVPQLPAHLMATRHETSLESGLPARDAERLLRRLGSSSAPSLRNCTAAQLRRLAAASHFLPRALELAGFILENEDSADVEDLIRTLGTRENIMAALSPRAIDLLDADELLMLRLATFFDNHATRESLEFVARHLERPVSAPRILSRLKKARLLGEDRKTGTILVHPLDATVVSAATPPGVAADLHRAIAAWYVTQRSSAERWVTPESVAPLLHEAQQRIQAGDVDDAARALEHRVWELLAWHGGSMIAAELLAELETAALSPRARLNVLYARACLLHHDGDPKAASAFFQQAIDLANRIDEPEVLIAALSNQGDALRYAGRWSEAAALLERAGQTSRERCQGRGEDDILFHLALIVGYLHDVDTLDKVIHRLEQLQPTEWTAAWPARVDNVRCLRHLVAGDWAAAREASTRAITIYDQAGRGDNAGFMLNSRALAWLGLGEYRPAIDDLRQAQQRGSDFKLPRLRGFAGINLAWAQLTLNRPEEAAKAARAAEQDLLSQSLPEAQVAYHLAEAGAAASIRDTARADEHLAQAIQASHGHPDLFRAPPGCRTETMTRPAL